MANYPNMSNVTTDFAEWAQYGNAVAEGWLGSIWLIASFIITLTIMSQRYDAKSAFIVSSLLTTIFCIFFRVIGIVSDFVMILCIIITLIAIGFGIRKD